MTDRFENGMAVRRSVLGDEHVDRAEAAKTDFDTPLPDPYYRRRMGHSLAKRRNSTQREVNANTRFAGCHG